MYLPSLDEVILKSNAVNSTPVHEHGVTFSKRAYPIAVPGSGL